VSFLGLSLWATLALGLGVLVVVLTLYSVRWRMPQVRVSTTALWQGVLARGRGAGRLGSLEHIVSLALQLAIAAALVLAAGQPRFGCQSQAGRAVVLVLDASASMGTLERVETRLQIARRRAISRVELAAATDDLALVVGGGEPQVLVPLGRSSTELRRAIENAGLRIGPAALSEAVRRGCALLGGARGSLVVFTDGFEEVGACPGADVETVVIGEPRANIGITAFSAAIAPHDPKHGVLFAQVGNAWTKAVTAELRIVLDGRLLEVWPVEVPPGGSVHRSFEGLPITETGLLEGRLDKVRFADAAVDALKEDDRAFTVLVRPPKIPIDLVGASEPMKLVLQANPRYAVTARASIDGSNARATVVVGPVPRALGSGRYLLVDPSAPGGAELPFALGPPVEAPQITRWDDRHPVLRRVVVSDLYIARATTLRLPATATAVAASPKTPLVFALDDGQRRVVGLGFSLDQTNLPLRVGFPVLIYNSLDWLLGARDKDELADRFRTESAVRVQTPDNRSLVLEPVQGEVVVPTEVPGFNRVTALDGRALGTISVSVSSERETIGGTQLSSSGQGFGGRAQDREIFVFLLALAVALLLVEWITYQRRMTV
jgi:hypothetical protein